jgi:hypothetical protein
METIRSDDDMQTRIGFVKLKAAETATLRGQANVYRMMHKLHGRESICSTVQVFWAKTIAKVDVPRRPQSWFSRGRPFCGAP